MRFSKKFAAIAIVSASALAAGAAFAYWTTAGGGTGSATAAAGFANPIRVDQTSTPSGLVPGGSAGTLSVNFINTNSGPSPSSG